MDGNGRWARERNKPRVFGHRAGVASARAAVEAAVEIGVDVLTLYAFSEENWGRPKDEIRAIFSLIDRYVVAERQKLAEHNIRFQVIGRVEALPSRTQKNIRDTAAYLENNTGMTLVIALSYGSRQEIADACRQIAADVVDGRCRMEQVTPDTVDRYLATSSLPDPDLFIRTSGEKRLSNFLLWQLAYSELWFTEKFWPEFGKGDFYRAVADFQKRCRRFGQLSHEPISAMSGRP